MRREADAARYVSAGVLLGILASDLADATISRDVVLIMLLLLVVVLLLISPDAIEQVRRLRGRDQDVQG